MSRPGPPGTTWALAALLAGALAAGCATERGRPPPAAVDLGSEVAAVRAELLAVRERLEATGRQADTGRQDAETRGATERLDARIAVAERRLDELAGALAGVEAGLRGLVEQVARLEAVPAGVSGPARPGGGSVPGPVSTGPEELFDRGMTSFRVGELGQAVLDFEDLARSFPTHPLVPSAHFWMGESYFRARDFEHAAQEYQRALDLSPAGERAPGALFRLGLALRALRREEGARETWSRLLRDFPDSEAAQRARAVLRETGRTPRSPASGEGPPR